MDGLVPEGGDQVFFPVFSPFRQHRLGFAGLAV
jgi:hypothetical protein